MSTGKDDKMDNTADIALPEPFCFYKAIFPSGLFHFGLWHDVDEGKFSLEEAQLAMFEHLVSFFPPPPARVLAVGCDLGFSAHLLSQKGYQVTAIAQTREVIEYSLRKFEKSDVEFRALGFLDEDEFFSAGERYDILLFLESAGYLSPLDTVMRKSRHILKENGFLIIGGEVCYGKPEGKEFAGHLSSDFIVALSENGFRIAHDEKIGKEVSPMYDFVIRELNNCKNKIISECPGEGSAERIDFYADAWEKRKIRNMREETGYEIFVARKDNFSVKPYSAGDEGRILSMFIEVFGVKRSIEQWYWEFRDNPYGSHKISQALSKDGLLVAHYAGYPVPFYYNKHGLTETFLSIQIGDTMTRPEVRHIGRGKTSILSRTVRHFYAKYCEGIIPFTYGFNTGTIKRFGEKFLGYQYIDPVPYRIKHLRKFSPQGISWPKRLFGGYSVKVVGSFDEGFDHFFERVAPNYNFLLKRDSRYLSWRYRESPGKDYLVVAAYKRKEIIGWSVFFRKGAQLMWGDALFDRKHEEAVGMILEFLVRSPLCKDIETIEGWFSKNPVWWNEILNQSGFELTSEPSNLYPCFFILTGNDVLARLRNYFYYTMGDSDLF